MSKVVDEILGWSEGTMFKIEPSWVAPDALEAVAGEFRSDYSRYYPGEEVDIRKVKYFPGLLCTFLYRVGRHYFLRGNEEIALEFSTLARYLTGIEIYYSAAIGPGLRINHGAGLVVGARTVIGKNCLLHQNITLGDRHGGRPTLGNNVVIYPGSSVLGAISIGDNVTIGANTLVLESIADNSIVFGNPNILKNAD